MFAGRGKIGCRRYLRVRYRSQRGGEEVERTEREGPLLYNSIEDQSGGSGTGAKMADPNSFLHSGSEAGLVRGLITGADASEMTRAPKSCGGMQWRVSPAGSDLLQFNNFLFENSHVHSKILSLFKPSTEVIRKGKAAKPNEFGKMVKLQEAENQIVVDCEVYARRPNDADLLIPPSKRTAPNSDERPIRWPRMPPSTPPRTRQWRKPRV